MTHREELIRIVTQEVLQALRDENPRALTARAARRPERASAPRVTSKASIRSISAAIWEYAASGDLPDRSRSRTRRNDRSHALEAGCNSFPKSNGFAQRLGRIASPVSAYSRIGFCSARSFSLDPP